MTALLGGHVDMSLNSLGVTQPHIQAGKVRPLLMSRKISEFSNVPTLKQLGYKNDISSVLNAWYAPLGLSDAVKRTLVSCARKIGQSAGSCKSAGKESELLKIICRERNSRK